MRFSMALAAFAAAVWVTVRYLPSGFISGDAGMGPASGYAGRIDAAEFPSGLDWLNTGGRELSLAELEGKVVLLDFWTYGCINCIHIIPDLKKLEAKYPDELVVIGVHSAKFEQESETANIRRLVLRYELEHPVVNDKDFVFWDSYGARGWPHLALIDPEGRLIGTLSGEGHYELLDEVISGAIAQFDAQGKIDRSPIPLLLESRALEETDLLFPGRVLADADGGRLFIADTNHNRIVITSLDGIVHGVIGGKDKGFQDGSCEDAKFTHPQGLTLSDPNTLYVADTENHALRRIDLQECIVETVAGLGRQVYLTVDEAAAGTTGLNSPWDVLAVDDVIYVAMAGQHQIWAYDPQDDRLYEFAGSRREALTDGPRLRAGLNQPSGLTTDGKSLYIADPEASAIRVTGFDEDSKLQTIVGTGLFEFGDVDGTGRSVRLQHPLDVEYHEGLLYITDTYNDKIKRLDPETRRVSTLTGGDGAFDEPGGLSIAGNYIYVADTNHHQIQVINLESGSAEAISLSDTENRLSAR